MPEHHDDEIAVVVDAEGQPASFVWRRFEYFVVGIPQRFYRRRGAWWRQPRLIDRLDSELWRVEAAMLGDQARSFDLRREPECWFLELAWE